MDGTDTTELCLLILCICIYLGYHVWLYLKVDKLAGGSPGNWFSVYGTMATAKQLWAFSISSDEKEAVTGVQTLRNALMVVALMSQAAAYIGARALPSMLFETDYNSKIWVIGELDPITGGPGRRGLVSSVGKLAFALGLIWLCVLCLCQAARFYVHLGFLVKVVCSKHNTENWQLQEELLAVTQQGHLYFSLSWRIFYAFGLAILYLPGITSLLVSTVVLTAMLYFSDHLPRATYSSAVGRMRRGRIGRPSEMAHLHDPPV